MTRGAGRGGSTRGRRLALAGALPVLLGVSATAPTDGLPVSVSSHGRAAVPGAVDPGAHDMMSPRENGTLAILDAATGARRSVSEVGPYAAALGIAAIR